MTFSVLGVFKNESHIINEWIEHYINEGCSEIILINNDSNDDWESKVKGKYDCVKLFNHPGRGVQRPVYNKFFRECTSKWLFICDLDEFLYSRLEFKTVKDYLDSIHDDSISAIQIPWTNFGSNNHITQPPSVVDHFTKRVSYTREKSVCTKTIVRRDRLVTADVHWHQFKGGRLVNPKLQKIDSMYTWSMNVTDKLVDTFPLKLNHYIVQSKDHYWNTKVARGGVADKYNRSMYPRDQKFYDRFNHDDNVIDIELKTKQYD